jgi:hypothetical protein
MPKMVHTSAIDEKNPEDVGSNAGCVGEPSRRRRGGRQTFLTP